MDRELIERLAKEAGLADFGGWTESNIEHFAALIAEECAKVCDHGSAISSYDRRSLEHAAAAIRQKFSV